MNPIKRNKDFITERHHSDTPSETLEKNGTSIMGEDSVYLRIAGNFDRHAAGAPRSAEGFSRAFIDYLKIIYPPEVAELVRHLKVTREFYASAYDVNDYASAGRLAELSWRGPWLRR